MRLTRRPRLRSGRTVRRCTQALGNFHRAVSTSSIEAQAYFDQGMRLLWAFNHDESTRSFARAAQLDPDCAACYWGVALTVGPNYNLPVTEDVRARVAWDALKEAQKHAAASSAIEQALIGALAARYPGPQAPAGAEAEGILKAYAVAMQQVAARFPPMTTCRSCAPKAQMTVHAWKLWTPDGRPVADTPEIEARLESVLARAPNHPGANHYYIHLMEASATPQKARRGRRAPARHDAGGRTPRAHARAHHAKSRPLRGGRRGQPSRRGRGRRLSGADRTAGLLRDVSAPTIRRSSPTRPRWRDARRRL